MKWYCVDDELPKEYGFYLVWNKNIPLYSVDIAIYHPLPLSHVWLNNKTEPVKPTHWMELPKPPRNE